MGRYEGMATFKCKDIGMEDSFEVKDENESELMDIVTIHAKKTHNMEATPEMTEKVQKAIKRESDM